MKKFDKITRLGRERFIDEYSHVIITEKLDGANASIEVEVDYDNEVFKVTPYSRNRMVNEEETLRGWYGYATEILAPKLNEKLGITAVFFPSHFILYGEWLVPHSVTYKEEAYHRFYPFALYDVDNENYLNFPFVTFMARLLDLDTPEIFYAGKMQPFDQIKELVGKSQLSQTENTGEGIVLLNEFNSRRIATSHERAKWVTDKHRETSKASKVTDLTASQKWIFECSTDARIDKSIYKLFDEGKLPEVIDFPNFGDIARPVIEAVWEDIMEEEEGSKPELFDEKEARKTLNKRVPPRVRNFIELTLANSIVAA